MVATNSLLEGTITSLAMQYHSMHPIVSPPAIQSWTVELECGKALVDCRSTDPTRSLGVPQPNHLGPFSQSLRKGDLVRH